MNNFINDSKLLLYIKIGLNNNLFKLEKPNMKPTKKIDLENMLMCMGEAFISLDQDWRCIYINDWASELLQKTKKELFGKIIWDVFPGMLESETDSKYRSAMAKGTSISFEIKYPINNKWLNVRVIPHKKGVDIFYNDITEKKLNVLAKEQIEKRFVKAFELCPIPLSITKLSENCIVDVNDSFLELFEIKRNEVIGNPFNYLQIKKHSKNKNEELHNCLNKKDTFNKHEIVLYSKTGRPLNLILSTELIQIDGEDHCLSTYIDITEKLKSQKIIADSEAWFRSIADNSPAMIYGSDSLHSCNYVNITWKDFTGFTAEKIAENNWEKVIHPDDIDNFRKVYKKAFELKKPFNREYRLKRRDGKYRWIYDFAKPLIMPDGSFKGYIGTCADVHIRRTLYIKLERLVKERTFELMESLEKEKSLNDAKSRFVSMASHEFRTPLSSILSSIFLIEKYSDLIEKNDGKDYIENRQNHLSKIKKSINHLTEILNDFLSIDKLDQGKIEANNEEFDLKKFTEEITEEIKGILKSDQKINYTHTGENLIIQDKKIIKNIYLNLLSNAIKYSPEGKKINILIKVTNKKVNVMVEDNGIGIPLEDQNNLFTKFFRAGNVLNIEGTGLGLNIVKRYTELIGGTINFSSELEKGTSFHVNFPRKMIS